MDPLAHTLVGAALAETRLRRTTPLAAATLILGANAPDLDFVTSIGGTDASLFWRRGLTHGVVAMVLLPLALTGLMLLWDRAARWRRRPDAPPARGGPLLGLAVLAVLSHPALDWLNTYGVRLLMPFSGAWFYGDAVFILDPWLWLLMAAPVVVARRGGLVAAGIFLVLGVAATALVVLSDVVPAGARVAWIAGLLAILALRAAPFARARAERVASICVAAAVLYIGAMIAGSAAARADATAWLARQGIQVDELIAGPMPANPFARDVIARAGDHYHFLERAWIWGPALRVTDPAVPVGPRDEIVAAALAAPQVRGMRRWLRFPSVSVRATAEGYEVTIRDVRYSRRMSSRIGLAVVRLDRALRPR
jgi:inner membrane protein